MVCVCRERHRATSAAQRNGRQPRLPAQQRAPGQAWQPAPCTHRDLALTSWPRSTRPEASYSTYASLACGGRRWAQRVGRTGWRRPQLQTQARSHGVWQGPRRQRRGQALPPGSGRAPAARGCRRWGGPPHRRTWRGCPVEGREGEDRGGGCRGGCEGERAGGVSPDQGALQKARDGMNKNLLWPSVLAYLLGGPLQRLLALLELLEGQLSLGRHGLQVWEGDPCA